VSTLGSCKICASPFAKEVNRRLARGDKANDVWRWLTDADFSVQRQLMYKHRQHITDPRETLVERARKNPAIRVDTTEFLETARDLTYAKFTSDPDLLPVKYGFDAVRMLEARKEKQINVLMLIANASTGNLPEGAQPMLEGQWLELLPPSDEETSE